MKNMIRIIAAFLCVILVVGAVGCTNTTTKTQIITDADIVGSDGRFIYTIVFPKDIDDKNVKEEITTLSKQLRETFDIRVDAGTDEKIAEPESEAFEILVGNTNREESKTALDYLNSTRLNTLEDYLIKVIGEKIVIVANSDEVLAKAVRYFTSTYAIGYAEFTPLGEGYEYIFKQEYAITDATVAGANINEYVIVVPEISSFLWRDKATEFANSFKEDLGIEVKVATDNKAKASEKEILIGNTNRDAKVSVTGNDWIIKMVGSKLVVNGGNDLAIADAMDALIELQNKCITNKEPFALAANFELKGTYSRKDKNYYMSWNDEFSGKALDRTYWQDYFENTRVSTPSIYGGHSFRGDARDCYVSNGTLKVPGIRRSDIDFEQSQTSTNNTMAFRYGIVEMLVKTAKHPVTSALWAGNPNYIVENGKKIKNVYGQRMELDILENFGKENHVCSHVHNWFEETSITGASISGHNSIVNTKDYVNSAWDYESDDGKTLADEFHLYSIRWTPYEIAFALDGDEYYTMDLTDYKYGTAFTRQPQFLIIGASYGAPAYGPAVYPKDIPLISSIEVDYVRVYQTDTYKDGNIMWKTPEYGTYKPELPREEQDSLTTNPYPEVEYK